VDTQLSNNEALVALARQHGFSLATPDQLLATSFAICTVLQLGFARISVFGRVGALRRPGRRSAASLPAALKWMRRRNNLWK
jgi:hypothetical protein